MIADESLNKNLINALRDAGYFITSIAEHSPGISDAEIAVRSLSPPNIIISEDKDFGEMVYHQKVSVIGVILLRYEPEEFDLIRRKLLSLLEHFGHDLQGKFTVITFNKTRIRTL